MNYAHWLYNTLLGKHNLINKVIDQIYAGDYWLIENKSLAKIIDKKQFILDLNSLRILAFIPNKPPIINKICIYNNIAKCNLTIKGRWELVDQYTKYTKNEYADLCQHIGYEFNEIEILKLELLEENNGTDSIKDVYDTHFFIYKLINKLYDLNFSIAPLNDIEDNLLDIISYPDIQDIYQYIDYNRCRLPKIEESQFTDYNKGIWELVGIDPDILTEQGIYARNPRKDLRLESNIGIDFGTSSTVVAYEDLNGRPQLLCIGLNNFEETVLPEHYENPTVLEFLNIPKMLEHWNEIAQQPLVNWSEVRCSHEALHNLRNNNSDPQIVGSILNNLKQWALREAINDPVRIIDQINGFEYQLAPLELKNPVKGQPLQVKQDDTLDPIELYAWFLGLNINWRQRGLFLKYYMTFPVSYPREVKEKILASFRRGLLRSLPAALTEDQEIMDQFFVEESGSEPAAYVASAIKAHNIKATDAGTAYAVFDFGGGTTDFDFGYYRWSTNDEYNHYGVEEILEHFGASGDRFLGGENLLENMAYMVFKHNLDFCRQNKISFTKPLDADLFSGSEMLIDDTLTARTNTLILISKLRPIWEQNLVNNTGIERVVLINRLGEKISCELIIPVNKLFQYINKRILQGLRNFFSAMKNAFHGKKAEYIHILLAGNSSKSERLQMLFDAIIHPNINNRDLLNVKKSDDKNTTNFYAINKHDLEICRTLLSSIFGSDIPHFKIHKPLKADSLDPTVPTAKTGVALGILQIYPGTRLEAINQTIEKSGGEAPFPYIVGRIRRGKFQTVIMKNSPYNQWKELGLVPQEGLFNFYVTQSDLITKTDSVTNHSELFIRRVIFPASYAGQTVYVSASTPTSIKVGCSKKKGDISEEDLETIIEVSLLEQ